jgi:hypothetical protein
MNVMQVSTPRVVLLSVRLVRLERMQLLVLLPVWSAMEDTTALLVLSLAANV